MKNLYLENTNNHHDKFYHMIENKDGVSFTASWGRIGSNGRTQIYDMSEWDKIHRSKINKGYKSQHHNNPTNWIQGMSNTKKQLHKKVDKKVKVLDFKKRKVVGEKLLRLRSRFEDWTSINGWEYQDNQAERKNKDGEVVWKRGDWEFVDDMYGIIINGGEFWWDKETYKKFNKLWKRYEIDVHVVRPDNPNFTADWEQLQQMDWGDIGDEVTLGLLGDPITFKLTGFH